MADLPGEHSLDLPYEDAPGGGTLPTTDGPIASGLVVLAGVIDVPEIGKMPAMIFRFARPDGSGFYPPTTLVVDEDQAEKLIPLMTSCVRASIREARR